jgi:hypothetical protein
MKDCQQGVAVTEWHCQGVPRHCHGSTPENIEGATKCQTTALVPPFWAV